MEQKLVLPTVIEPDHPPRWRVYALAVVVTVATLFLRQAMTPWLGDRPNLILFVLPIVLSAYVGGAGPGMVSTLVAAFLTDYFVMPPVGSLAIARSADVVQWMCLVLAGALISLLSRESHAVQPGPHKVEAAASYRSTVRLVQGGFAFALASMGIIGLVSYLSIVQLRNDFTRITHTQEVLAGLDSVLRNVTDAESGQRGFLITGDENYLEPYHRAVRASQAQSQYLVDLMRDNPGQQARMRTLVRVVAERITLAGEIIEQRRREGFAGPQQRIIEGTGKALHDRIRRQVDEIREVEGIYLKERESKAAKSAMITQAVIIGGGLLAFAIVGMALLVIRRDLAGRQQAEAELERFFSLSLDLLGIASADGYFKRISPSVTGILGWSVEEFLSRPFLEFVHPDDHVATLAEVERQLVRGEKVLEFENQYLHKDGSWRVLSWRSMPGPDGRMYASARDVTEFRRMEQALRAAKDQLEQRVQERTAELTRSNALLRDSEIRFRALIEHSGDSIALIDAHNKVLYASPSVVNVEGYTPAELIGTSGIENTHPDDIPLVHAAMHKLRAEPGTPVPVLWRRRHKGGHWLWLEGTAVNLLGNPAVRAIVTNYRDVTDRKRAEQKVVEQMEHLALLDQVTRAIGERMDLPSIFQVVVRTLETSMPVDFCCVGTRDESGDNLKIASIGVQRGAPGMEPALTEGASIGVDKNGLGRCMRGELVYEPDIGRLTHAFPVQLARGGMRSLVLAPLRSESRIFGVLVAARRPADAFSSVDCEFLRQVSEHVALAASQAQLHAALQLAYDDLRQTQQAVMQEERLRAVGEMASGIAHDINNALSPVMLYTESLLEREPALTERARGYLQIIQRAVGDVAQTVSRMREFYRPRDARVELAEVDVNRVVKEVLDLTRPRWSDMALQGGIAIRPMLDLAPDLPAIMGVEGEMRDALTNLVFNAVDAMPQGGKMTLRTRFAGGTRDGHVVIEIRDEGIGMDEETRRRCLEPFFTTKGERGTGLGLPMVFGMAKRQGADLEIESTPGAGTSIRLKFGVSGAGAGGAAGRSDVQVLPPLRLLLVDDDPVLLNSLRSTLETDGHEIVAAFGGTEGIAAFRGAMDRGESFAAVITDLGMPHVDGRRVAAAVKDASPDTPVILLTGWGQRLVADDEIPANVDQVLSKPPKLREVRQALARCCRLEV